MRTKLKIWIRRRKPWPYAIITSLCAIVTAIFGSITPSTDVSGTIAILFSVLTVVCLVLYLRILIIYELERVQRELTEQAIQPVDYKA